MGRRKLPVAAAALVSLALGGSSTAHSSAGSPSREASSSSTAITASGNESCALTSSGGVKCWGGNNEGQLGDGTTRRRLTPVTVSGLSTGVGTIAVGGFNYAHTCALLNGGEMKCWGDNSEGQLGDGTTDNHSRPGPVSGLSTGVVAIAAGDEHTCAVLGGGAVKCWGYNALGELGDGTRNESHVPVDVAGLSSGVRAIAAVSDDTCAITSTGGVKCWGANFFGQLGDGTTTTRATPVDVSGLSSGVEAIAVGGDDPQFNGHVCALLSTGAVKCWGDNTEGQLGDGTTTSRHTPVAVSGLESGVRAIAAGATHTCALLTGGGVKCWGDGIFGTLGDGRGESAYTPVDADLSGAAQAIAAGSGHSCAFLTAGSVECWGYNADGQVGDGTRADRLRPVRVLGFASGVSVLTARVRGRGIVTGRGISCRGECAFERPQGTKVVLQARPGKGRVLVRWSGACTGRSLRCTLVLRANVQITAAFGRRQ